MQKVCWEAAVFVLTDPGHKMIDFSTGDSLDQIMSRAHDGDERVSLLCDAIKPGPTFT